MKALTRIVQRLNSFVSSSGQDFVDVFQLHASSVRPREDAGFSQAELRKLGVMMLNFYRQTCRGRVRSDRVSGGFHRLLMIANDGFNVKAGSFSEKSIICKA